MDEHNRKVQNNIMLRRLFKDMAKQQQLPIMKLYQDPNNPKQDCFLMTRVQVAIGKNPFSSEYSDKQEEMRKFAPPPPPPSYPSLNDDPKFKMKPQLFVASSEVEKACLFYSTVFEACIMPRSKRKAGEDYVPSYGVEVLIGSTSFLISTFESDTTTGVFSLRIDDVHSCVEKAVEKGAVQLGNVVQVYSRCLTWCTLAGIKDPYGNVWIIYSKLCPNCYTTFIEMF